MLSAEFMTSLIEITSRPLAQEGPKGPTRRRQRGQYRTMSGAARSPAAPVRKQQVRITPAPVVVPDFWQQFAVIDRLGAGSFGEVLAVKQLSTGREFALKLLKVGVDAQTQNEITILRDLGQLCPGIVQYYGYLQVPARGGAVGEERPFVDAILMELIQGEELFDIIVEGQERENIPALAWFVLEGILPELICAHEHGVVHRDIKPENIMLEMTDEAFTDARLIDFGLSCTQPYSPVQGKSCAGRVAGSPPYIAPEVARSLDFSPTVPSVDPAVDMYALGVTLFTLLSGESFLAEGELPTYKNIEGRLQVVRPQIKSGDPLLDEVVLALLSSDPEERGTAEQLLQIVKMRNSAIQQS